MATFNQVNKALADRGYKAELVKGKGYCYFVGEDTARFMETGLYVGWNIRRTSVDEIIEEFESRLIYAGGAARVFVNLVSNK